MNLAELKKKLKADSDELVALQAKESLTAEEQARWDELLASCESLTAQIEQIEADNQKRAQQAATIKGFQKKASSPNATPRLTRSGQPEAEPKITRQHNSADDDPNAGFRDHREFHMAVMEQSRSGTMDDRLRPLVRQAVGSDEHSTFSDGKGGYLVPEGFLPGLMTSVAEGDPTAALVKSIPMANQVVNMNARTDKNHSTSVSGGLVVYRREEAGTVAASNMNFEQLKLEATMLMGVAYATEEILDQSPVSFASLIGDGFADEFASKIIREKMSGTGVGQLEGVLNTPALITVSKETGQSADTILYANIVKMRARCWRYSQAIWLYNHDCLSELINLADDNGRLIWQPSARDGEPDMLHGRPAYPTEWCQTLGNKGDLLLGVWSEYYYGTYGGGMRSAESPYVRWLEHERAFKYFMSNAGKVSWRTPLTPANSTSTLSPFVVIEAR